MHVALVAAAVAYKERYRMPVIAENVKQAQPEQLQAWFVQCLTHFRQLSPQLTNLPYQPHKR